MASNIKHKCTAEICGDLDIVSQSREFPGLLLKTIVCVCVCVCVCVYVYVYIYIYIYIYNKLNTSIYLDSPVLFEVITSELPQKRREQLSPA